MNVKLSKNRHNIYLPTLSNKIKSRRYVIFDCESSVKKLPNGEKEHTFKLVSSKYVELFSDGKIKTEKTKIFWRIKDFHFYLQELFLQKRNYHLIAHNSKYDVDICDIFDLFDTLKLSCKIFNPKTGNYLLHFGSKLGSIIVLDSLNFFRAKLETIGKEINFKKLSMPKDNKFGLNWIIYCIQDTNIIFELLVIMSKYFAKFDLGDLRPTVASLALTVFRKKFHHTNMLTHTNLRILNLEYSSYFGGRTEAFQLGKLPKQYYYYYDFNSLYPSVMVNQKYSIKLRRYFPVSSIKQLRRFIVNHGCIATVKISTKEPLFPKFHEKFTVFPVGNFITTLATAELKLALELNLIKDVLDLAVYFQEDIFTNYVDYFHKQKTKHKSQGKTVLGLFDKLMLNSLYGKFGQKTVTLKKLKGLSDLKYDFYHEVNLEKKTLDRIKVINYLKYIETKNHVSTYSIPSIATEVTSLARVKLVKAIRDIGWKNVFYCDTDSILTNKEGMEIIEKKYAGKTLGKLVLEKSSNSVVINGLKDYTFGIETRLKGVPKNSKRISKNKYKYEKWITTTEALSRKNSRKIISKNVEKVMTRKYSKGIINFDKSVSPIELKEF